MCVFWGIFRFQAIYLNERTLGCVTLQVTCKDKHLFNIMILKCSFKVDKHS